MSTHAAIIVAALALVGCARFDPPVSTKPPPCCSSVLATDAPEPLSADTQWRMWRIEREQERRARCDHYWIQHGGPRCS